MSMSASSDTAVVPSTDGSEALLLPTDAANHTTDSSTTMLATAQVRILASASSNSSPVRALTDSGSQLNLITHDCVQRLGLRYDPTTTHVTGIGNTNAMRAFGIIDTHVHCTTSFRFGSIDPHTSVGRIKNIGQTTSSSD